MRATWTLWLTLAFGLRWSVVAGSHESASSHATTTYWENHREPASYTVRAGETLVLRGAISIEGQLIIDAGGQVLVDPTRDASLVVDNIDVSGAFRVVGSGGSATPYERRAEIELRCGSTFPASDERRKGVVVRAGGELDLLGAKGSSTSWTRLAATASPGSTCLRLAPLPSDWAVGDEIVVASTDFDPHQSERRVIAAIGDGCVTVDRALAFQHFGAVTHGVDERAEVALLSRSIVFRGCVEPSADAQHIGGHMIFLEGFRRVRVQGVELANFGQGDELGRYPLHFHLSGRVPADTVLRFNAIRDSNFRAITLHGTQGVAVERNVAYNITGHAVMLEDGAEFDNTLHENLVVLVREKLTRARLGSDAQLALSAFYITNTDNVFTGNAVAGVEGAGFWIHTRLNVKGQSYDTGRYDALRPFKIALRDMRFNSVHSCATGMNVESPDLDRLDYPQQKYSPPFTWMPDEMPVLRDVVVHHCRQGAWLRMFRVAVDNWVVGDVTEGVQVLTQGDTPDLAVETHVRNSRFVGGTANRGTLAATSPWQFVNFLENRSDSAMDRADTARMAIKLYDGPLYLSNITFVNWYSQRCLNYTNPAIGTRQFNTFAMAAATSADTLTFENTDVRFHVSDRDADGGRTTSLLDVSGDISGHARATLLPDWAFYDTPSCRRSALFGLACPHRYVNLDVVQVDGSRDPTRFGGLRVYRNNAPLVQARLPPSLDLHGMYIPAASGWLYHPIVSPGASYTLQFLQRTPPVLQLVLSNANAGDTVRLAIVYPPGSRVQSVVDRNGFALAAAASLSATSGCDNCFFFDRASFILQLRLRQERDRVGPDRSCPPGGCWSVRINAALPTPDDSGVPEISTTSVFPQLQLQVASSNDPWYMQSFLEESAANADDQPINWCEIDDPCLHRIDEGNRRQGILAYYESPCDGVGCYSSTCRYCKLSISSADVPFPLCPFEPNVVTAAPTPRPTGCAVYSSQGDRDAGIQVVADAQCIAGGLGCINAQCRYCKNRESTQSAPFRRCSDLTTPSPPSTSLPPNSNSNPAPAPASLQPPVVWTSRPPPPADPSALCVAQVLQGDLTSGVSAVHDPLCRVGGLGCFSNYCRYCQTQATAQSSHLLPCASDAMRAAVVMAPPPAIDSCSQHVSAGDVAIGLSVVSDSSCRTGGLGCLSPSCRFCRVRDSPLTAAYWRCDEMVEAQPVDTSPAADVCQLHVSAGDIQAGVSALTDVACGSDDRSVDKLGCFNAACRFCQTRETRQSAHLHDCTALTQSVLPLAVDSQSAPVAEASSAAVSGIDACAFAVSLETNVAGIFGFTDPACVQATDPDCFAPNCRYCRADNKALNVLDTVDVQDLKLCRDHVIAVSTGPRPLEVTPLSDAMCATSVAVGLAQRGVSAFLDPVHCNGTNPSAVSGCFARSSCRFCWYREPTNDAPLQDFPPCPGAAPAAAKQSPQTAMIWACHELAKDLGLGPTTDAVLETRCQSLNTGLRLEGCVAATPCRLCRTADDSSFSGGSLPRCNETDDEQQTQPPAATALLARVAPYSEVNFQTAALAFAPSPALVSSHQAPANSGDAWTHVTSLVSIVGGVALVAWLVRRFRRDHRPSEPSSKNPRATMMELVVLLLSMAFFAALFRVAMRQSAEHVRVFREFSDEERGDWGSRVNSTFHACTIVPGLLCSLYLQQWDNDYLPLRSTDLARALFSYSCGYFIFDLYVLVRWQVPLWRVFVVHHVVAVIPYLIYNFYPGCGMDLYLLTLFLLVELAVIPLNITTFLEQLGFGKTTVHTLFFYVTYVCWFAARVVLPLYNVYVLWWMVMPYLSSVPFCIIPSAICGHLIAAFCVGVFIFIWTPDMLARWREPIMTTASVSTILEKA
ncbi:hypothetical protein P43SY_003873 [Pythium insidiosum]|uniref:Transmembrane protein n=1 Tax=Pythium insidiosum TaxID=114742 RepID=A0AAD5LYK2_PYTIN|nr:hypothetical protein P43SY_003873 [Pythium insidiosum]